MKVWLDDERDPSDPKIIEYFGSTPDMVWVKTPWDAIKLLETGEVTWISLDNDLGPDVTEGYTVAQWLERKAFKGEIAPLEVEAHTQNPVRKKDMYVAIRNMHRYWYP
jgi:hypothetical protein